MKALLRLGSVAVVIVTGTACERGLSKPKPDAVLLQLAPDVVSSEDGSLVARATVVDGQTPLKGKTVRLTVVFTDQLGNVRSVPGVTEETDRTGAVEHTFEGLFWAGAGSIHAEVLDGDGEPYVGREDVPVESTSTFAVVDLTPPSVTIQPPTEDLHVGRDLPLDIEVTFTDLMGVANVTIQSVGEMSSTQSRIIASGSTGGNVVFEFNVPGAAVEGPTITLYALAEDLSGNVAAATPLTLTVDANIRIAVPPGFDATQVAAANGNYLQQPRALVFSPKDEMLYVADNSGGACGGQCIWKVDPANGTSSVVTVGMGTVEGVALDATGDNLYYSDRQNRIVRLTWNAGNMAYETPTACNDIATNPPQDPFHLVFDATLGILVTEQNDGTLKRIATCAGTSQSTDFSDQLDTPWGVAEMPTGDFLVSDVQQDAVFLVDQTTGAVSLYEGARLDQPMGVDWLDGGTSTFADSLFVASNNDQRVYSTKGSLSSRTAVSTVDDPIDVAFGSGTYDGTLFLLTENGGRIFRITGY